MRLIVCRDDEIAKLREAVDRQAEELEFLHQRVELDKQTIMTMGQSLEKMAKNKAGIVHCGECLFWAEFGRECGCTQGYLEYSRANDYCSQGERREQEDSE